MLKKALLAIVAIAAILLIVIAMQPASYRVVRSASIQAPPAEVFAQINDFHNWNNWSPWARIDPNMKTTYTGPPAGKGAVYYWTGNDQVGEGRMTISDTMPASQVDIQLEFVKPFPSQSLTTFQLRPEGAGTRVDWIMTGENNFMAKGFMLFMGGMDKAVGPDFEKGLAQLKAMAESRKS